MRARWRACTSARTWTDRRTFLKHESVGASNPLLQSSECTTTRISFSTSSSASHRLWPACTESMTPANEDRQGRTRAYDRYTAEPVNMWRTTRQHVENAHVCAVRSCVCVSVCMRAYTGTSACACGRRTCTRVRACERCTRGSLILTMRRSVRDPDHAARGRRPPSQRRDGVKRVCHPLGGIAAAAGGHLIHRMLRRCRIRCGPDYIGSQSVFYYYVRNHSTHRKESLNGLCAARLVALRSRATPGPAVVSVRVRLSQNKTE